MGTGHTHLCGTPHILWLLLGHRGAARAVISPPGCATGPHLMCVLQRDLNQTSWPPQGLCQWGQRAAGADWTVLSRPVLHGSRGWQTWCVVVAVRPGVPV